MFDFLSDINYNVVFNGISTLFGGIVLVALKIISKNTKNTIDDAISEAFDQWYKRQIDEQNKKK